MKDRILLVIIVFFILGSVAVSSAASVSYTAKSFFYGIAALVYISIGAMALYRHLKFT